MDHQQRQKELQKTPKSCEAMGQAQGKYSRLNPYPPPPNNKNKLGKKYIVSKLGKKYIVSEYVLISSKTFSSLKKQVKDT